uniref:AT-hook motif nuclear-localized protein n=1 Tax=Solanum lycopersicum TaxID=4081 RepID=A0A3Q7GTZ1_SOLLC
MAASDASSDYHMTGSAQPGAATQSGAARQRKSSQLGQLLQLYQPKLMLRNEKSATGVISSVTFHQTDTSGGKVTFETMVSSKSLKSGRYDLLTSAGSYAGGMRKLIWWNESVSIKPRGRDVSLVVGSTVNW